MGNPFVLHVPGPHAEQTMERLRTKFAALHADVSTMPASREKSIALTHLEEAGMWANKAAVLGDPHSKPVAQPSSS